MSFKFSEDLTIQNESVLIISKRCNVMKVTRPNFREEAEQTFRKIRAILILTNDLSPKERDKIDQNLKDLSHLSMKKLKTLVPLWQEKLQKDSEYYGVVGTLEELEKSANCEDDGRSISFIAKFHLEKLFKYYERRYPIFNELPPHARIGIYLHGYEVKGQVEWFLLEASLFEDMANLWNLTHDLSNSLEVKNRSDRLSIKQFGALQRATIKATFNLLEGYLNGLAFDILVTKDVTLKEREKLTERDKNSSRLRYLSLRDKLLQYPKIAIGEKHSPLDEGNCKEIKAILDFEQYLRHALIHPTPQPDEPDSTTSREITYLHTTIDKTSALCDAVIDLIFKIDSVIDGRFGKLSLWLHRRDSTGRFPLKVFN